MKVIFRCDPAMHESLARPQLARHALPQWLRDMPRQALSDTHGLDVRTLKQCPPFIDAMSLGFVMPLPCDIHMHDGILSWDWDRPALTLDEHPRSPLSFHVPAQVKGTPFYDPACAIVKFNSFWTIELESGYSLYATHPINRTDLPFRLLTGLIDCDHFSDVGVLFPAVWSDPAFSGTLPKGTPVAQCFPVKRDPIILDCRFFSPEDAKRYQTTALELLSRPGLYRRKFRARRTKSPSQ